ncbi:MAG TPA: succinate CoA transferase [Lacipirellulaceae bacterium]|nr:succinate CoA transferase [Lacipirellulaceae bacterium]
MTTRHGFARLHPHEAAAMIPDGATVGFSGFTPAGAAKAVPRALAAQARTMHERGEQFQIRVLTGASTGSAIDDDLADAGAISWRTPYQSSRSLRERINAQQTEFVDLHLSHLPQMIEFGFFGKLDFAVVEAVDVVQDGRVYLSASVGASPTFLKHANKVIIEVNRHHSMRVMEMHDIRPLPLPPHRSFIPIDRAMAKIGAPFAAVDPSKIVGVVETDEPDGVQGFSEPDENSDRIAGHVVRFILDEMRAGRIPPELLPLQSGVGNVANAVMARLGRHPDIPPFEMYSEVFQDALVDLMETGRLRGASATSLTLSAPQLARVYDNMEFFASRIVLRPQELSNNPGVIRRLGVITINTVLEMDIFGCANSTHVCGSHLMNGVGGSGDFTRNAYLSFLVAPSIAKGGRISSVVPMVSHVDHNEHSVQVLVTEQGLADLRGLGPMTRARTIIDHCAHPMYREYLHHYLDTAPLGHIRHDLRRCFELHQNFLDAGSMLPTSVAGVAAKGRE